MKLLFCLIVIFSVVAILGGILYGYFKSRGITERTEQSIFLAGSVPDPLPEGLFHGSSPDVNVGSWLGKTFRRAEQTGANVFRIGPAELEKTEQKYPFKTYVGKGLQDRQLNVLKLDYNLPENPWWLRVVMDEVVETEPGKYLGKVHLRIIPNLPFTVGYFWLEKQS